MKKVLLLLIIASGLAGCALNTRYVSYTDQRFSPKARYYFINIYPDSQAPSFAQPYHAIGKVEVSGRASDGVTSEALADKARAIARAKGADAIINSRTEMVNYGGMSVMPGHCGYRYCHPPEYFPYYDVLLTFRGELIAFLPAEKKE